MTTDSLKAALEPCPFCGLSLEKSIGEIWLHPGSAHDGDCLLSGRVIGSGGLALWNRRASTDTAPVAATRAWANKLANMRQRQSSTPRCEPPGEYQINRAMDQIKEVLAASIPLYAHPPVSDAAGEGMTRSEAADFVEFYDLPDSFIAALAQPPAAEPDKAIAIGRKLDAEDGGYPAPAAEPVGMREADETLEQYADRVVAATRKKMLDCLDDDVIGSLKESHLIFGKACAMEAITTAMNEARKPI